MAAEQRYVVAFGSNQRHPRHGSPGKVLRAALERIQADELDVLAVSPFLSTPPMGPSRRRYTNAAALIHCTLMPDALLARLQAIEHAFGRKRRGRRWQARVLDLDIVLWSGGEWSSPGVTVPHPHFHYRAFVLQPAAAIAPMWRDPLTGLTVRHLHARLTGPRPARTGRHRRTVGPSLGCLRRHHSPARGTGEGR